MANDLKLGIKIGVDAAAGVAAIKSVDSTFTGLQKTLRAQIGKIASLDSAERDAAALGKRLEEAQRKVEFFRRSAEIGGESGFKEFAKDIEKAKREVTSAEKAFNQQQTAIRGLRSDLSAAGVDTKNLAAEQARLATQLAATNRVRELQAKLEGQVAARARRDQAAAANVVDPVTVVRRSAAARDAENRIMSQFSKEQLPDITKDMRAGAERTKASIMDLRTGIQALAGAAVLREFIQANASLESMTKAMESVSGSSDAAKVEMAFVRAEAQRLGVEIGVAANSYVQLSASSKGTNLEGESTRKIWSSVAEAMARLGKSGADTQGALIAISQMMSKGTVASEELRGQLGERLPGAFQIAARAMGVSTAELGKMLEQGQVVSDDFLPKFATELQKTFGGGNIDTFQSNLARLKNTLNDVFIAIGDTGAFAAMTLGLKYVAVGAALAWEGFELLGKTLANIAYSVANLDFSGYQARQQATLQSAREDLGKVIEKIFPIETGLKAAGKAGEEMGASISGGAKKASAELPKELKKSIDESIKDYQRLADAAQSAWQQSLDQEKTYLQQAAALRAKAAVKPKDSSIEGQASATLDLIYAEEKLQRLQSQPDLAAAQQQAEIVRQLAANLDDQARAQEAISRANLGEAAALEAAAAQEKTRQDGLREEWKKSEQTVKDLQTALESIGKGTAIKIESEAAKAVLEDITAKLDAIKDKTITVNVVTLSNTGQPLDTLSALPAKASGGPIIGPGGPTADQVLMLGSNGEHMLTAAEVRAAGGHAQIYRLRQAILSGMLPRFATGGAVLSAASRLPAMPGATSATSAAPQAMPHLGRIDLGLGGNTYPVYADADVAGTLRRAALKLGRRS